jgi:hypothetical protein
VSSLVLVICQAKCKEIQSLIAGYTKLDAGPNANFGLNLISRSQLADGLVHVLVNVVAVDDSVDLEFDAVRATQLA